VIAALTGGAWVFYFADAPTLASQLFNGTAPLFAYASVALLTFTTYSLGGLMREQVCTYMCPWPRIQGAMMDADALSVTYRRDRGEPRGQHKKNEAWGQTSHCIDCNQCVAACPMGIDIRDGAQLECINCALCIDACDDVMARIGLPAGLIAYDTDANILRRAKGEADHFRFVRPRTVVYAVILAAVSLVMLVGLITRPTLGMDIIRDRNPNFVRLSDGSVRNGYTVKLMNHAPIARNFQLEVSGIPVQKLQVIGLPQDKNPVVLEVEQDRIRTLRVLVTIPASAAKDGRGDIHFTLREQQSGETRRVETIFVSRERRR
jgi:cytochrome c oxidase accessory protein FixG